MIQVSLKSNPLVQKSYFCQKNTNKWQWKFSGVVPWPKLNMQNTAYTKPWNEEV